MCRLLACFAVLAALVTPAPAQSPRATLTGTIVGSDGEPLPWAGVVVRPSASGGPSSGAVRAAADGLYRVDVPAGRPVRVEFAGAAHRGHTVALLPEAGGSTRLDVRLGHLWLDDDQSYTRLVGSFNGFDYDAGIPLDPQGPDAYAAFVSVDADSFAYELMGATTNQFEGRILTRLTADAWAGPERPVVAAPGGVVKVVMEAATIDEAGLVRPSHTFGAGDGYAAAFARFHDNLNGIRFSIFRRMNEARSRLEDEADAGDLSRYRQELEAAVMDSLRTSIDAQRDPFLRRLALLQLLSYSASGLRIPNEFHLRYGQYHPLDPAVPQMIMDEVPPASPLWTVGPGWVGVLVEQAGPTEAAYAYAERVAQEHYDGDVVEGVLYDLARIAYAHEGPSSRTERLAGLYVEHFGGDGDPRADNLQQLLAPDAELQPGDPAPDYFFLDPIHQKAYTSRMPEGQGAASGGLVFMNGGATRYAFVPMDGRVVLLDFWRPEADPDPRREDVRALMQAYGSGDFTAISAALTTMDATAFERFVQDHALDAWPQAYVRAGFMDPGVQAFGVARTPMRILIGWDGTVRAVGADLTGEALRTAVEEALRE